MSPDPASTLPFVLRAYHRTRHAEEVTLALAIEPTETFRAGEASDFPELGLIPNHGWILSSRGAGHRIQLVSLLERLHSMRAELGMLMGLGWEFDVVLARTTEGDEPEVPAGLREALDQLGIILSISVI